MSSETASLFQPLQLGDITIRNRVGMSALTRNRAPGTVPNDVMDEYYVQRAVGGAGLIQVSAWKKITDDVHAAGSYIYAQLWHLGRVSHPDAPEQKLAGVPVYAPSAIAARGGKFRHLPGLPGYVTPTAIDDPWTIIKQFKEAATNAKEAGFDGVELHGANGYLITQFLDTNSNQRTDQWGGSVENRSRFGLEVLKALVEVFGRNVAVKLSPTGGYNDRFLKMPLQETLDTYSYFITEADKLNLAYITLVRYSAMTDVEFEWKRATYHDIVESYRHLIKNAKVFVNAGVTPEEGAKLISSGTADAISIGFSWITHPDLVKRIQHGKPLNNIPDFPHLQWGKSEKDLRVGYTDYPEAEY
ncbi:hypothetical protein BDQ12DRAFT_686825 [Crucibulum laeve]|uniref:NADH:flavin oxidoreductase/NADH oxidase N-terminal domain-containing protein n=1 Tax=Crucibulum laeve TaxID=68775 RepID=A0A5C3LUC4_9AGAR|nr:hypothetical protein BDQ12DRAFT_686825 [Crucibulum laeve]